MPQGQLQTPQDVEDLIRGLTIFGTGGGGRIDAGRDALLPFLNKGVTLGWRPLEEIGDDELFCSLSGLGSIAPVPPMTEQQRIEAGYPKEQLRTPPMVLALRALEAHLGKKVSGVYPIELGAGNATTPLAAAAAAGIDMIDCDCAGRAIPEMSQSLIALAGIPFAPASYADPWGMSLTVTGCHSTLLGERLGKAISTVTKAADMRAQCARAAFVVDGKTLKKHAIGGGLTRALELGRAISAARAAGKNPVESVAAFLKGHVMLEGRIVKKTWESRDGYMYGDLYIDAVDGRKGRIWLKNENHVLWIDDVVKATSPDLITIHDRGSGESDTNTNIQEGMEVVVIVSPAPKQLKTAQAVMAHGPRHYGFDFDYIPVEERQ
jgi:DUF917 family protein